MKRINNLKIVRWDVEEHLGGREGLGKGPRTGSYKTEEDAIYAMAHATAAGNGATCIVRNRRGEGRLLVLGLSNFSGR